MEWWNLCGIHSIPCGIWVEWNHQNGWDITQNIFHVEWVESTWNDMDSIWIPCGMWGESKDLLEPIYLNIKGIDLLLIIIERLEYTPPLFWTRPVKPRLTYQLLFDMTLLLHQLHLSPRHLAQSPHSSPWHPLDLNSTRSWFPLNTIASHCHPGGRIVVTVILVVDGLCVSLIGVRRGYAGPCSMSCHRSLRRRWSRLVRMGGWGGISGGRGWQRREAWERAMTHATACSISSSSNSCRHCQIDIAGAEPIFLLSNQYCCCEINSCYLRPFLPFQTSYHLCWTCVDRCRFLVICCGLGTNPCWRGGVLVVRWFV